MRSFKKVSFTLLPTLFLLLLLSLSLVLAAGCVETEEEAPPAAKSFAPDPAAAYLLIGVQSGKCVEVTEAEPRALQIRACDHAVHRRFRIEATGGGFYRLHNTDTNLCIDIEGAARTDGARLVAHACADAPSQQWSLPEPAPGVVKINSRHSGKSMDVFATNTADGTNLIQWIPHDQSNQHFRLQVAPAGPQPTPEAAKSAGPGPVGFATIDGIMTGGGNVPPTTVTTLAELNGALAGPSPRVVRLSGTISGDVTIVGSSKTLEGAPEALLRGHLAITGSSNVIVRDLKIISESCARRPGCQADTDGAVTISGRAHNVWIDHCDLSNGGSADLIVTEDSDDVTVSFTRLSHTGTAKGKRMGSLIGMGKNDRSASGHLRVTFDHDLWDGSLDGALPRVRFGQVHLFNNDFASTAKNRMVVEAAADAKVLLENNHFQAAPKLHSLLAPTAQIVARGNVYAATTGSRDARGEGFRPPYPYKLDDAAAVPAQLKAEVGPRPRPVAAAPAPAPATPPTAMPAPAPTPVPPPPHKK